LIELGEFCRYIDTFEHDEIMAYVETCRTVQGVRR